MAHSIEPPWRTPCVTPVVRKHQIAAATNERCAFERENLRPMLGARGDCLDFKPRPLHRLARGEMSIDLGSRVEKKDDPMAAHKFKMGQTVRIVSRLYGPDARGNFQIVRLLPDANGVNQYRIKSSLDGQERVVAESDVA
jgi:hypothetical protein